MALMYLRGLGIAVVLLGCNGGRDKPSDARGDGTSSDAPHIVDARMIDARIADAHITDAHITDAHITDAHIADAHVADARMIDARVIDAPHVTDARMIDAPHIADARMIDARTPDAALSLDAGTPGVVSCYTEGNPSQSCTLPTHCCFSNYTSAHNGQCSNNACLYGTISCDGPEDCNGGQHCCSHALFDSGGTVTGYSMACQANACGAAPANYELCHLVGPACSNGGTCVTAYLHDNDLPRTLDICQ